ncbi:Rcs stress response system protein RcsF [Moellerella wisconsensis]|uniref:Rcs stress response system protein RcsF n=1 Tax=Moellerella wisconsensis TaxID=158849 RepID=UPI001F4DB7CF|nr:Rcs stress response system protein RcsF [Moellerella wisconsensis]UNH24716.1 Rcs stress response system protein RcsF [Moellerella wisconsensis]
MRTLLLALTALSLSGCGINQYIHKNSQPDFTDMKLTKPQARVAIPKSPTVKLFSSPDELLGKPFKDLGVVSGQTCRETVQSPPTNIKLAQIQMLNKAAYIAADAVLLHQCQTMSAAGCYQAAICEGSALQIIN